ncbi:MAG: hypothetical protein JXR94_23795 [Candidatus Hydrogenedentes bacterium]|nr:hypothetical protein [Candidatus Hydrogenedentota bacterium]
MRLRLLRHGAMVSLVFLTASASAQDTLGAGLVKSAVDSVDSGSDDMREFGLMLLGVLAEVDGEGRDAIEDAFEVYGVLARLEFLAGAGDAKAGLAGHLAERVRKRLGLDAVGDAKEVPLEAEDATPIPFNEEGWAWIRFNAKAGMDYEIAVSSEDTAKATVFDADLAEVLAREPIFEDGPVLVDSADIQEGMLYARFRLLEGDGEGFRVSVKASKAPNPLVAGDSADEAKAVAVGEVFRGELDEAHEALWVKFAAEPGGAYEIRTTRLTSPLDTTLTLYAPGGTEQLDYNDDDDAADEAFSLASGIRWLCTEAGEYPVQIARRDEDPGSFDFSVKKVAGGMAVGAAVRAPADREGARELQPSDGFCRVILDEGEDEGWLTVAAAPGTRCRIQCSAEVEATAAGAPVIGVERPEPRARDAFGPWCMTDLTWVAHTAGPHTLHVCGASGRSPLIRLTQLGSGPVPAELILAAIPGQARPITVEKSGTGTGFIAAVSGRGTRYASFVAQKSKSYRLTTATLTPDDLEVCPAIGEVSDKLSFRVLEEDEMTDAGALVWDCSETGEYFVRIEVSPGSASPGEVFIRLEEVERHDGFREGDEVILGHHDCLLPGGNNWVPDMNQYVGKQGTIASLRNIDHSGSFVVRVDVDDEEWVWRTRNLGRPRPLPPAPGPAAEATP